VGERHPWTDPETGSRLSISRDGRAAFDVDFGQWLPRAPAREDALCRYAAHLSAELAELREESEHRGAAYERAIDQLHDAWRELAELRERLAAYREKEWPVRWQCGGCKTYFRGSHLETCPVCDRRGYWSGSFTPPPPGTHVFGDDRHRPTPPAVEADERSE
jgi:hypothetical protein